jgi:hypothetical protein
MENNEKVTENLHFQLALTGKAEEGEKSMTEDSWLRPELGSRSPIR